MNIILRKTEQTLLKAITAVTFFIVFSLSISIVLFDFISEEQDEIEQLLVFVDRIFSQSELVAKNIRAQQLNVCNEAHIQTMQKEVLGKLYIEDLVFKDGQNHYCSASQSFNKSESYIQVKKQHINVDKIDDGSIIESNANSFAIRYGAYSVIYPVDFADVFLIEPRRHETLTLQSTPQGSVGHVVKHFNIEGLDNSPDVHERSLHIKSCSEQFNFCAAFLFTAKEILLELFWVIIAITLLSLCCAYVAYRLLKQQLLIKRTVKARVKQGLAVQGFYPVFQSIVDVKTQQIIGCEILARFSDEYGQLTPDEFIPVVSELGESWRFTQQILNQSVVLLNEQPMLKSGFRVSFNVYAEDVANNNIAGLARVLSRAIADFIWVMEITEDKFLEQGKAQQNLKQLSTSNIQVAIDDFGTGYSNLQHLKLLYCHYLKIDRSFVLDIEEQTVRSSLLESIVNIAQKANLQIVAEGIEEPQQLAALQKLQVQYAQGWLFSKPLAMADFARLMATSAK